MKAIDWLTKLANFEIELYQKKDWVLSDIETLKRELAQIPSRPLNDYSFEEKHAMVMVSTKTLYLLGRFAVDMATNKWSNVEFKKERK